MKKEFIPYEQALELKELGFDEPCIAIYIDNKLTIEDDWLYSTNKDTFIESDNFTAPLYQQAFRFFREKYGYNCFITSSIIDGKWYYFRENLNDRREDSEPELTTKFDTYEESELACLKKLIELAKQ